jgi:carbon storage regulator CsrA
MRPFCRDGAIVLPARHRSTFVTWLVVRGAAGGSILTGRKILRRIFKTVNLNRLPPHFLSRSAMLVITAKEGESIIVPFDDGTELVIRLIHTTRGKAKIGFAAPTDVRIYREDVWRRIQAEDSHVDTTDPI